MTQGLNQKAAIAGATTGLVVVFGGYLLASRSVVDREEVLVAASADSATTIETPNRLGSREEPPSPALELPVAWREPPDLTAEFEVVSAGATILRTVTRTADRALVELGDHAHEWLFVRNPVDPRRVTASFVDHDKQAILEYDESSLRIGNIARGWAEVVSFGVDPELLDGVTPKDGERVFSDLRFRGYRPATAEGHAGSLELCWNEEWLLPLRLHTVRSGVETVVELRAIRREVDRARLTDPRERFPGYAVVDAIDWLEKGHDHAHAATERP